MVEERGEHFVWKQHLQVPGTTLRFQGIVHRAAEDMRLWKVRRLETRHEIPVHVIIVLSICSQAAQSVYQRHVENALRSVFHVSLDSLGYTLQQLR